MKKNIKKIVSILMLMLVILMESIYPWENIIYAEIKTDKNIQTDLVFTKGNEVILYDRDSEFITYKNEVEGGEEWGEIQYEIIKGSDIATIKGSELSIYKAGEITVRAIRLGDGQHEGAEATYTLTVHKGNQELAFDIAEPDTIFYGQASFENRAHGYQNGEGKIIYSIISGQNIAEVNKNTGEILFKNGQTGTVEVQAVRESCDRFNGAEARYQVKVVENQLPENPYTISGDRKNESGWYTSDIRITPAEGYQIGTSNEINAEFYNSLIIDTEGNCNGTTIYLKKDNKITVGKIIDDSDLMLDKSNPVNLRIEYSDPVKNSVINNIMYGFYYDKVIVTIYVTDYVSGIENIQWKYTKDENGGEINVESQEGSFNKEEIEYDENTAKVSFALAVDEAHEYQYCGSISVIATDTAGNCSCLDENDENQEHKKAIVVDNISPTRIITFSEADCVVDAKTLEVIDKYDNLSEENYRLLYKNQKDVQATIEITEANFQSKDVEIKVNDIVYENVCWKQHGDQWTGVVTIDQSGNYVITINYTDCSGNKMMEYTSPEISIDNIKPVISVQYDTYKSSNGKYYNQSRTAKITVIEHNFRAEDINTIVIAKDVTGKDINVQNYAAYLKDRSNWTTDRDVHTAEITFDADAGYDLVINYMDMMGNQADTYDADNDKELTENSDISQGNTSAFVIDKTIPDNIHITYSQSKISRYSQAVTWGYYNPEVTITITADDITSGVDYIEWYYNKEEGTSRKIVEKISGKIETDKIIYSADNKTAQASFTLKANGDICQYRGKISVVVIDRAGNRSNKLIDNTNTIVVDSISPTRIVRFSKANQIVKTSSLKTINHYNDDLEKSKYKLYYQKEAKIIFSIEEANFYPEDVVIKVDREKVAPINWKHMGNDLYQSSITLREEGSHIVTMYYTDRSGNKMVSYTSNEIIIDKTKPVMHVSYSSNNVVRTVNGRKYYNKNQTATIKITEHNFRSDDVAAVVTAKDVVGKDVNVTDYVKYLKDRSSWKKDGDVYTAKITYSRNANYTFDISYKDLSGRSITMYKQDKFTVDKSKPKNLKVTYSTSVFDNKLNSASFGFYNGQVTVTIRADDNTSGIHKFVYSCRNAQGVSGRRSELIDKALSAAKITYINGGKTAVAKFTIPKNTLTYDNQFRGTVSFKAFDRSGNSSGKKEKKTVVVDNISPQGTVTLNEPIATNGGTSYYTGNITATIKINEANFYPEDVSIKVNGLSVKANNWTQNGDNWTGTVTISGDGNYKLNVHYKDRSQNKMKSYVSNQLIIDSEQPSIVVKGIKSASANKEDKIGFSIITKDENLKFSSFQATLTVVYRNADGTFKTKNVDVGKGILSGDGKTSTYTVENLEEDGIYTLKCKAVDWAGNSIDTFTISDSKNKQADSMNFSVNRKGSVFMLEDYAQDVSERFYNQTVDSDIKIVEVNVDPVQEYHVELNKKELVEGTDYIVHKIENNGAWYRYEYVINAELFKKEGSYSIVVSSVDKTKTKAYSDIKNAEVNFVVDKTIPVVIVSGMEKNGRYQAESQIVTIIPTDDGGKLYSLKVEVTGRNGTLKKTFLDLEGRSLEKALESGGGKLTFQLVEGMYQNVHVVCIDKAGNSYRSEEKFYNITVSPSRFVIFRANIILRWAVLFIGIIVIIGGIIFVIVRKLYK